MMTHNQLIIGLQTDKLRYLSVSGYLAAQQSTKCYFLPRILWASVLASLSFSNSKANKSVIGLTAVLKLFAAYCYLLQN